MRYDAIKSPHHHLCSETSDMLKDYFDPELDNLLKAYFSAKSIHGFNIRELHLQIVGDFLNDDLTT